MSKPSTRKPASRGMLLLAAFVIIVAGMKVASDLLLPFLVAVFLSIICVPPLKWLSKKRVPEPLGVLIVVLGMTSLLLILAAVVGSSVAHFADDLPEYKERTSQLTARVAGWLQSIGVGLTRDSLQEIADPGRAMSFVGTMLAGLTSAFSNSVLVILTMVFMLLESCSLPSKIRLAIKNPESKVEHFAEAAREVQHYLALKSVMSLATGALVALWVSILGVDLPLLWGLLAFLLNYVPNIGSIIAAVPPVLLAAVQFGWQRALLIGVGFVAVNFVIGNIVEPKVMGKSLGLSPLVVFLSLVFWGWVWGPVGMLLSVPLTVVAKIFLVRSEEFRWLGILLGPEPKQSA